MLEKAISGRKVRKKQVQGKEKIQTEWVGDGQQFDMQQTHTHTYMHKQKEEEINKGAGSCQNMYKANQFA